MDLPTTGVDPGTIYYVEEDGSVYIWDGTGWTNISLATGPRGATGPTGPQGADGITGEIEGVVDTAADLPTTGIEPGTIYYVEDEEAIYDYDAIQGWVRLGSIQGPRGATGPTGANGVDGADGADGIVGEISGIVATVGDLPTTGIDPGAIYYVEEDGSVHFWDGTGWTAISLATGPRGVTGPTGPTGPQGEDGIIGEINGTVATAALLPTTGITPGTIYYVEDEGAAYVYDAVRGWVSLGMVQGPRGATGATGAAGSDATAIAIIPFASQQAPNAGANAGGEAIDVSLIGFGYMDYAVIPGDADVAIPIDTNDKSFNITGVPNRQLVFSVPFDMTINSLYITVGNWEAFPAIAAGRLVFPYVQLYAAPPDSNTFLPIPGAVAKPAQGIDPAIAAAGTMRAGSVDGLSVNIDAGTRIAICGMMEITGDDEERHYWLYYTGGIGMTRRV